MRKTIYGFVITTLVLVTVFVFAACGSNEETALTKDKSSELSKEMNHKDGEMNHGDSKDKVAKSSDFSAQRNNQTSGLIDAYEQTKSALDANDKAKTAEGAKALLAAIERFDVTTTKITDSIRNEYEEIYESAKEHAEHIVKSELDHQKEHFEELTTDFKDLFALIDEKKEE